MDLERIVNLNQFEEYARKQMEPYAFAYYYGGAGDEITLRRNLDAWKRFSLRPRVFVDISTVDISCSMLGTPVTMPVGFAPTALHKFAHPDGELASARATAEAGALICLSTLSTYSIEEVAKAGGGPRWFQLYVHKGRELAIELVQRAVASGYSGIVITADLPVPGYREREFAHDLTVPDDAKPANFPNTATEEEFNDYLDHLHDRSLTWDDLTWIREAAGEVPVLVKGILTEEDAVLAAEHGAEGVIVSNHGGRQLDRSPAPIDVLDEIVQAVGDECEVFLDGGVRRGIDVVTALALGAKGVFVGRPFLYALAAAGEEGVGRALHLLREEIANAMTLLGVTRVDEITRTHVRPP
jgi:isopentenyl diphosphate isomerase/L-lactate dehydrogenase-like FMN-dependent dehydrogenase